MRSRNRSWLLTFVGGALFGLSLHLAPLSGLKSVWESPASAALPASQAEIVYDSNLTLSHVTPLRANDLVRIVIPYSGAWSGSLRHLSSDIVVPIHRRVENGHEAWVIVPSSGSYDFVVRAPQAHEGMEIDSDPYWCFVPLVVPHADVEKLIFNGTKSIYPRVWEYCGGYVDREAGSRLRSPLTLSPEESVIIKQTLDFGKPTALQPPQTTLHNFGAKVYGSFRDTVSHSGIYNLGYWYHKSKPSSSPGSVNYQPEPKGCPLSFTDEWHQGGCKEDPTHYAWQPLGLSQKRRITTRSDLETCLAAKTPHVIGDSVGHALYRGMLCVSAGYAGIQEREAVEVQHRAHAGMNLFLPADFNSEPTYQEFLDFMNLKGGTDVIWHIGIWMVSYVPATDWKRGLRRIAQYAQLHHRETGVRHWFTTLTSPYWQPGPNIHQPQWQTLTRTYQWNLVVLETAKHFNITVIDLFTPTTARTDGRTDNCHFCDYVIYEIAHLVYRAIC